MDPDRIAGLKDLVTEKPSRRDVVRGLTAVGVGLGLSPLARRVQAQSLDACRMFGDRCKSASQCCSGICKRRNGKKKCRAHHRGGCAATSDSCQEPVTCKTSGNCLRTTGNASFCGEPGGTCGGCAKDIDCKPTHGPGAACVVCAECDVPSCFAAAA